MAKIDIGFKPKKIVVSSNINEDVFLLASKYINDPNTMFNSFSQYVECALKEFNGMQKQILKSKNKK